MRHLSEVLQLERPLIGFDLETTGTNPQTSAIVELALEIMVPGQPVKDYRTLINPIIPIPPGATKVHGITHQMVRGAPTFKQLAGNLFSGMTGCDFITYSGNSLDYPMMVQEFRRAGYEWDYQDAFILDGLRLWQVLEGRSLSHAVERWLRGTEHDRAAMERLTEEIGQKYPDREGGEHTALWDIKMSTLVVAAQLESKPELPRTVKELHTLLWPDRFDATGKFRWRDGELIITFGEHRDKPLRSVPRGYFSWMLKKDFSPLVVKTCVDALNDVYPTPPVEVPSVADLDPDDDPE